MEWEGPVLKMNVRIDGAPPDEMVQYVLPIGDAKVEMNPLIGHPLELEFIGKILCIHCGRETSRSFAQGYCYPCFISLPQTDACILHPELCQAHLGVSRDMGWSKDHCLQDHYVYLALSSGLKVGVTRQSQVPTRWIDQGAWKAITLVRVPNRYTAGTLEVELKKTFNDKTNWRHMLTNKIDTSIHLVDARQRAIELLDESYREYLTRDDRVYEFSYPVLQFPEKVKSINLDKEAHYQGRLSGIKGQYLIFQDGHVINVRKYGGYVMKIRTGK